MSKQTVYLDNNATSMIAPSVLEAIIKSSAELPGNPSSIHRPGQQAKQELTQARSQIASFLNVKQNEIIFSSGATESTNCILRGLFSVPAHGHIITSNVEHPCVYETLKFLEAQGCSVSYLEAGLKGAVSPELVAQAIRPDTKLIALIGANNETGVLADIPAIAKMAKEAQIPFFVDGVALLGKELFTIPEGVSAMTFSGHKIHGPKGIGFAFIRSSLKLQPLLFGGAQELGKRAGSENLQGILGIAKAICFFSKESEKTIETMRKLRDYLENSLREKLSGVTVNGSSARVSNTTNLSFSGIEGETLLTALDMEGIAVSHGSACASGALEPSRILLNMGLTRAEAASSIRFSLSRFTTLEEIEYVIEKTVFLVKRLRTIKTIAA